MATVVIAPDSFKGSLSADRVATSIASGWRRVRPDDTLLVLPMADGGEGTIAAMASAHPDCSHRHHLVTGPDGRPVDARWLMLNDGTAIIELAETSGLPLMDVLDPLGATTRGLGEMVSFAIDQGASRIVVGLGGSASTDAGLGALEPLGLQLSRSNPSQTGVAGVDGLDWSGMRQPPPGGITLLVDTEAVMMQAPSLFGPQKGATAEDVVVMEEAFARLISLCGNDSAHLLPGSGAAGATAWGFATFLGATIVPGAAELSRLIGIDTAMVSADLVITGEGRFDQTSLTGKVVSHIHSLATRSHTPGVLIVGNSDGTTLDDWEIVRLVDAAGSPAEAMTQPEAYLHDAAVQIAGTWQPR